MASKLFSLLKGIDDGIKKCKENAKLAGFNVNEHTTLYSLANMFKEINNVDNMRLRYTNSWKRPSDWLDIETILRNAPEMNGMQPRFITLYYESTTSTFYKYYASPPSGNTPTLGVEAVYTSDGEWVSLTSAEVKYTWAEPNGYHYIIGYSTNPTLPAYLNNAVVPEHIFGNCKVKRLHSYNAVSIRTLPDLIDPEMEINALCGVSNATYVRNIDLSGVKTLKLVSNNSMASNSIAMLAHPHFLVSFSAPDVEKISIVPGYNSTHRMFNIPYLYLPKVKTISYDATSYYTTLFGTTNDSTSAHSNGVFLDAPELERISGFTMVLSGCYLPKLTSVTGSNSKLVLTGRGTGHYLPLLKEIGTGLTSCYLLVDSPTDLCLPSLETCDIIQHRYYTNSWFLNGSLILPKLHTLKSLNAYTTGFSNNVSYLVNGLYVDMPSLKTVNSLCTTGPISLQCINIPSIETITSGLGEIVDYDVIFPETLTNIPSGFLSSSSRVKNLHLPDNFCLSGLDLSAISPTIANLREILSKLADVSDGSSGAYEITFGATNIAKLTTEEWQVAIDKGWVITDLVEEASE